MSTTKTIHSEPHNRRDEELSTEKRRRESPLHLPNFSLDTAFHYYAIMRLLGYFYENNASDLVKHFTGVSSRASHPVGSAAAKDAKQYAVVLNGSSNVSHGHTDTSVADHSSAQATGTPVPAQDKTKSLLGTEGIKSKLFKDAVKMVSYVEAMSFMSWTAYNFYKERKETINAFADVVSAERGLDPGQVGVNKINKSDNPFIITATDKFMWQTVSRVATDSLFFVGIKHGIIGKALSITLERSVFFNRTASENLKDMVEDAKWNNLGTIGKQEMVRNLVKVTQQCCKENHYSSMTQAEIKELDPFFCRLADGIMQKKLGFKEAVYVLGDVVKHPEKSEQAVMLLETVESRGLYGIASDKRVEKGLPALPKHHEKHEHEASAHAPSFVDIVASNKKGQLLSGRPFGHIGSRMP